MINRIALWLFGCCLISQIAGAEKAEHAAELFGDNRVRTFEIEVVGPQLEALKKDNRQYVQGTIREGANVLTNVAIHLKGMGSFGPLQDKPSFAVRFDRFAPGQLYSGLSKLLLN